MQRIFRSTLYCVWFLLSCMCDSQAQTKAEHSNVLPAPSLVFFVDSTDAVTIDSLRLPSMQARFTNINLLSEKYPTWVKVTLKGVTLPGSYCFYTDIQEIIHVHLNAKGSPQVVKNGRFLAPHLRSVPENFCYVCIDLQAHDTVLYINVRPVDTYPIPMDLSIHPQQSTLEEIEFNTRITFMITGAVFIIVMCSFTLFLFLHDSSYLWFSVYVVCAYSMSNTEFIRYVFGDYLPAFFLNADVHQVYFIVCPLSLLWLCVSFFHMRKQSPRWHLVFLVLLLFSLICLMTIPGDPWLNSYIILFYNVVSVLAVAIYAAISYFKYGYVPGGFFLLAFVLPLILAMLIVVDYLQIADVSGLNLFAGLAVLAQSIILFIGVATRYQQTNQELMRVTLTKWQKEHESKLFQMKNSELQSHNEIIEKQKMQLSDQARKLEEMNATKDKLLSVVSHDLRAPVGNLRSILSLLSDRRMTPDEFHNLSGKLKEDVEGVYEMLEDVLHWVKSQHEGIVPRPINFELLALTEEVIELATPLAQIKNVSIEIQCGQSPVVHADPDHVHIILRNLIGNAIKFAKQNTQVRVELINSSSNVVINIIDQGIGMTAEDARRILTGMKINSTRGTHGEKGTGLGLLLCREFIHLNGGTFYLESTPDLGTTVTITLQPGQ